MAYHHRTRLKALFEWINSLLERRLLACIVVEVPEIMGIF